MMAQESDLRCPSPNIWGWPEIALPDSKTLKKQQGNHTEVIIASSWAVPPRMCFAAEELHPLYPSGHTQPLQPSSRCPRAGTQEAFVLLQSDPSRFGKDAVQ